MIRIIESFCKSCFGSTRTGSPIDTPPAAESPKKEQPAEDDGLGGEDEAVEAEEEDEVLQVGDDRSEEDQKSLNERAVMEAGDSEVKKAKSPKHGSPSKV